MATYNTPGVYVEEISKIPPSIAEVESAVPAFVGYTEKAMNFVAGDLLNVPTRISSLAEFQQFFGGANVEDPAKFDSIEATEYKMGTQTIKFDVKAKPKGHKEFILYHSLRIFFENGGSTCYIVSVGLYSEGDKADGQKLLDGVKLLELEDVPTLLCVPEASKDAAKFKSIIEEMLNQSGRLKDRFALLDTLGTTTPKTAANINTDVDTIKNNTPPDKDIRRFGAAYYPFLESAYNYNFNFDQLTLKEHKLIVDGGAPADGPGKGIVLGTLKNTQALLYEAVKAEFSKHHVILPPSPAVAGIIARVDREKGYWKAPANAGVIGAIRPVINLSFQEHGSLNIDPNTGKSINAVVWQPGNGTVLMGARTLDGVDNEWRYVSVRRFFSIVEESIKKSTSWVVFEPNTSATWVKVQAMIENFLFVKWRDGALAGAKPEQAYQVNVGLNKTMTSLDILEGRLIVEIKMAVARPAEFIVLRFEHMLQNS